MPNIDTSAIEGFDSMSAEQKLDALLKIELPDMSQFVSKEVFDKKASEAAGLSKKLKETVPDSEVKQLRDKIAELEKSNTIKDYTEKFRNMGYEPELAAATAKAMADGDMATVFANGEKHRAALEQKIKEDLMNKTPKPGGAGGDGGKADPAVEKAKELAQARFAGSKSYDDVLNKYKK